MGVVFAKDFSDDTGRFLIGCIRADAHIFDRVKDTPVDGFESIPRVWQRPGYYNAHRIIHICEAHLIVNIDSLDGSNFHRLIPVSLLNM
jgi:hypothetical protein